MNTKKPSKGKRETLNKLEQEPKAFGFSIEFVGDAIKQTRKEQHLTQEQFGLWCAIAIHDTSSVVGASLGYGDEALRIATTVKLSRTLWINMFVSYDQKTNKTE